MNERALAAEKTVAQSTRTKQHPDGQAQRVESGDVDTEYIPRLSWLRATLRCGHDGQSIQAPCEEAAPARNIPSTPITPPGIRARRRFCLSHPPWAESIWRVPARRCWPRICWHRHGALQACIYEHQLAALQVRQRDSCVPALRAGQAAALCRLQRRSWPGKASGSVHDLILSPWHAPASIWSVGTPPTAAVPASIWKAQQRALKIRADMRLTQLAARQDGYRLSAGLPDPWSLA
ncbi:hypothetical protein TASIC1_0004014900 [Trichoderma asperellum]|uniref:Uncharacterized protein n=1 Tax=Trichoderma asperellum TaxID=101201 RepID=A0A6V8QQ82_TRIAP|nr:hypothetical protein TASIC1_0004014900 [Trichoderma asperellum]